MVKDTDISKPNINVNFDDKLRPNKLSDFIGQEKIKNGLKIFIGAAKKRNDVLSHVLLYGGPGLGKTTLANIISKEIGANLKVTSGPALERTADLAALLSNLEESDVLFIDEIHRLNRTVEEVLYPAMEDYAVDLVLGKGPSANMLRLDIPKFTLVGATTRAGSLSSPLRDRFGVVYQIDFYSESELEKIIKRSAKILKCKITDDAIKIIAKRSRKTPRIANRLLHRIRDYAQYNDIDVIDSKNAPEALKLLDVDEFGLDTIDRKLLKILLEKFNGGPVGIKTLAAAIHEEPETLEQVIEPYLLRLGFIDRTSQGRKLTDSGKKHLDSIIGTLW